MTSVNACTDLVVADGVATIISDNPPVNALGHAVRDGLLLAITAAAADPSVRAIVLGCRGRTFFAGADINEFGGPLRQPDLHTLIDAVDNCVKPTVAAIFGTALGGGFELAMACHFRVATVDSKMGLPEVRLGLLPGAGGTQRLPRLVGPEKAVTMIVNGTPITAPAALADGAIDAIVGQAIPGAIAFAQQLLTDGPALTRVRDRDARLAGARRDPASFEAAAQAATRKFAGVDAPAACVAAVRNAFMLPFDAGVKAERDMFLQLLAGDQSAAQRYIFFAEREAAKLPDLAPVVRGAAIRSPAVIGGGTMGGGIAMCFANAGIPVNIIETTAEALKAGLERIKQTNGASVKRGALQAAVMEDRLALISGSTDWNVVVDADIVIEAVFEDMALKQQIFGRLDRLTRPGTTLASNTSTLDLDAIAGSTSRAAEVVGMHFFSPANVMKLLEIVRGSESSAQTVATAVAVGKLLGKIPVVVGNCEGFVGNRMLARRGAQCERLLLEGASPQDVDAVVLKFGFPMGAFALRPAELLRDMAASGRKFADYNPKKAAA